MFTHARAEAHLRNTSLEKPTTPPTSSLQKDRSLNAFKDKSLGYFWNTFWNVTTSSYNLFRLRFYLWTAEESLFKASRQRANAAAFNAYKKVPAYRAHVGPNMPAMFNDLPLTTKENYIKPYGNRSEINLTLINGQLPLSAQIDTSTGTTGTPTNWIRGKQEINTAETLINFASRIILGNSHTLLINAFALGPWATGITVSNIMRKNAMVFSAGADAEKILNILKAFPPEKNPNLQYILTGYPPFMKDFTEFALANNLDLDKYKIKAIVGGEEISESLRQQVCGLDNDGTKIQPGFEQVISTYGASDLDINIGYETAFEVALRRACRENPELKRDLFGENETIPSIFHFDPLNYYIETNENKDLIFTCVRSDRLSPRIRYNLEDRGQVMPMSKVLYYLDKHHVQIPAPNTHLPILFVWGREGAINYRGAKIAAAQLEEAISKTPEVKGKIKNFAFNSYEENNLVKIEIWLEFKSDKEHAEAQKNILALTEKLIESLSKINQDFRFQLEKAPENARPTLRVFPYGLSPMSNQDPHRKRKYIFKVDPNEEEVKKVFGLKI